MVVELIGMLVENFSKVKLNAKGEVAGLVNWSAALL
jgi:hypothetical protein